jgi:hypothetical protein
MPRTQQRSKAAAPMRSQCRAAVVAVLASLVAAGCAGVPDHGKVHTGNVVAVGNSQQDAQIRVLVHGPTKGASPEDIVSGFLVASAGSEVDHAIARTYLTSDAGRTWQPTARALVYGDSPNGTLDNARPAGTARVVRMHTPLVATIAGDGGYTVAGPTAQFRWDFRVVRAGGEWRIANPPVGLLLSPIDLSRSLRAQPIYFLNRDMSVVVPDTVFLSASAPGFATALLRALLHGPTSWLAPAVRTAIPAGTTLLGTVPVDAHGTATVNLSPQALDSTAQQRQQMSAQIVWTLRGATGVNRVRLQVDGNPFDVTAGSTQSRDAWPTYDPAALSASAPGYYRNGSRILSVSGDPLPGVLRSGTTTLTNVAISPDLAFVAGLRRTGARTTVYAGTLASEPRAVPGLSAASTFTPPSWDAAGEMFTVQRSPTPQVFLVRPAAPLVQVPAPELRGRDVQELRVSRDGTRVAIIASSRGATQLLIGRISTTKQGALQVDGLRVPYPKLADVGSTTWTDSSTVLVLARGPEAAPRAPRAPWLIDVDGVKNTPVTTSGLTSYDAAAGAPGLPALVSSPGPGGTTDIYLAAHGLWAPLGVGTDPAYPG